MKPSSAMRPPVWASSAAQRGLLVGFAALIVLAAIAVFARTVRDGAEQTDRLLRAVRATEQLRAVSERLVRIEAYAQLVSRGLRPGRAGEALSNQLAASAAEWKALERLMITMPPKTQGLFTDAQDRWATIASSAWQLTQLAPAEGATQGGRLADTIRDRAADMRERLTTLAERTQQQSGEALALLDGWHARMRAVAWRLLAGVFLLGVMIGWRARSLRWPPFVGFTWRRRASTTRPPSAAEPLERIEEQV